MSLNNIFQMIKADRYTADGREEIKKALAEETEDRTYNIGEISEKTGLQKTANGWVKPKKGGAGSAKRSESNPVAESEQSKPTEKKSALKLPDEKSSFSTDVNRMKKLKKEDYKQYTIQLEKLHSKYPINKWKDLLNKTTQDEAPRELTGDCKIRIRK